MYTCTFCALQRFTVTVSTSNGFPCVRAASSRGKTFVAFRCQMRGTASLSPSHQKLELPPKSPSVVFFSRTRIRMDGRANGRSAVDFHDTYSSSGLNPPHPDTGRGDGTVISVSIPPHFSHQNHPARRPMAISEHTPRFRTD